MSRSIAPQFIQVNGVGQAARFSIGACVVGVFDYLEAMAAKGEHLGHERNAFELPFLVQSGEDFGGRTHLNDLANPRSSPEFGAVGGVARLCRRLKSKLGVADVACHGTFVVTAKISLDNVLS